MAWNKVTCPQTKPLDKRRRQRMYIVKNCGNLTKKPSKIIKIVKNCKKNRLKNPKPIPYNTALKTTEPHPIQAKFQKIRICLVQIGYHYNRGSWNDVLSIIVYIG